MADSKNALGMSSAVCSALHERCENVFWSETWNFYFHLSHGCASDLSVSCKNRWVQIQPRVINILCNSSREQRKFRTYTTNTIREFYDRSLLSTEHVLSILWLQSSLPASQQQQLLDHPRWWLNTWTPPATNHGLAVIMSPLFCSNSLHSLLPILLPAFSPSSHLYSIAHFPPSFPFYCLPLLSIPKLHSLY